MVERRVAGTRTSAVEIGADTILKLGAQTPAQSAGIFLAYPQNLRCAPPPNSGGTAGAYHSGKTDIVKIIRVKKQGTVDLATS